MVMTKVINTKTLCTRWTSRIGETVKEVIAAGAIIIRTLMEMPGVKNCLVSDLGLREGVLIDLAMRKR